MEFGYTILYVDNVEATLAFYEQAFGLRRRFLTEEKNYGELETGQTRLAFSAAKFVRTLMPVDFDPPALTRKAPPIELGMVTDDVEAAYRRALSAGAVEVKAPQTKPWGQVVGYVRDLNGFLVEICSPVP